MIHIFCLYCTYCITLAWIKNTFRMYFN